MKKQNYFKTIFLLLLFSIKLAAQVPPFVPTNGLVGWWPFTGNANDLSGNNNNGTVNGAILTTDRFSNSNSAYQFNTNNYIEVLSNAMFNFASNNQISISFWLKTTSGPAIPISKQTSSGANQLGWNIAIRDNLNPYCSNYFSNYLLVKNGSGPQGYNYACSNTYNNQWHNLVFTYDNGTGKGYFDGQLVNTTIS